MSKKIKESIEVIIHFNMCVIGGFLGSYTIFLRGSFGSAQTANLIETFINLGKGNIIDVILRIFAFVIYIGMLVASFIVIEKYGKKAEKICIIFEMIGIFLVGLIPKNVNNLVALLPVFAISAFQWGNFNGTKEYSSPTLFSTGNVRQCTSSWTEYILTKDKKMKIKAFFYSGTLFAYHCGVIAGIYFVNIFQIYSIWLCLLPLFVGLVLVVEKEKKIKHEYSVNMN